MRKAIYSFILLLICTVTLHAQKPGYMGKRFMAGGEFSYGYSGIELIPLNIHYGISADMVMSRKVQLGGNFFMFKSKSSTGYYEDSARFKGYTAMVKIRFYRTTRKGAFAPIGKYYDIGFSYSGAEILHSDYYLSTHIPSNFSDVTKGNFIQPHFAFGNQTVFFNCIAADVGIRFGLPPLNRLSITEPDRTITREMFNKNMVNFYTRLAYMF